MSIKYDSIVGEITAQDYRTASVFKKYGIDFCCNGNRSLQNVCLDKNIMPEKIIENWRIAWAFYAFLASEPVKVGKLMNEVPLYSKDKEGSNFAILIAQLLNYLKEGKKGVVIDKMDSLNRYKRRYLKKDPRGAAFVALLSCLSKGNFNREKVEMLSAPHLEKLKAEHSISDIELVRYELLWEKVLELLD